MKTAKVITILNNKGGVGKTTSVANIGEALALMQKRVLLIDTDTQANLTTIYRAHEDAPKIGERTILQAFRDRTNLPAYEVMEGVYLAPSTTELAQIEQELVTAIGREYILTDLIDEVRKDYDYILIDTPPSLGQVLYNALLVADEILVPMVPEMLPFMGLSTMEEICANLSKGTHRAVSISGIFFVRVERGSLQAEVMHATRQRYGARVFETFVRKNVAVSQCMLAGNSLYNFAPASYGAIDYKALTAEIIDRTNERKG